MRGRSAAIVLATLMAVSACSAPGDGPSADAPGVFVTASPTVTATPTPAPLPPPADPPRVTVRIVGDIMLGRGVAAVAPPGEPVTSLRPLARHLRSADLTIGNLESTLSTDGVPQQPGDDSFAAPPSVLDGLAGLGVDGLSLANNHTGDYGTGALLDTVAAVRRSAVRGFGAGRDLRAASRPAIFTVSGVRIGVTAFNAIGETPRAASRTPGALSVRMPPRTGPLQEPDLRHLEGVVRRMASRTDVVIVIPHWGGNYTHVADPAQRDVGRRLVDAGADLVVGGHPHWVQGVEPYRDAVIAHSLGNLVFDMDFMSQTMEGVTLTATFEGDRLVRVALAAYRMDDRFAPRLLRDAASVLDDVRRHSRGPFARGPGRDRYVVRLRRGG